MTRWMAGLGLWVSLGFGSMLAQTVPGVEGTWQGTLNTPEGKQEREVYQVSRAADGSLKAKVLLLDQKQFNRIDTDEATFTAGTLAIAVDELDESFTGHLEADGTTVSGTLRRRDKSFPMLLKRATPDTAWPIPEPEREAAKMDPAADPAFEVATIKLTDPAERSSMFYVDGEARFHTLNLTLMRIMCAAWGMHPSQIAGLPSWATETKFDIAATPDTPGMPSETQLNAEVRKLIYERFGLKTHLEKRTQTSYRLTLAGAGPDLKIKPAGGSSQSFYMTQPGRLVVRDATIADFAQLLQSDVLAHPVVDATGLGAKRFNFTLRWQIDDEQALRMGMLKPPPPPESGDLLPSLLTALPEQIGLRVESGKLPVDVLVVDHIEKPSAN